MKIRIPLAGVVAALAFTAPVAWAKLPPPPPVDPVAKAAADEKKAAAAAKAKAELEQAMDRAVKNYQENMRKAGKPVSKPAAAAPEKSQAKKS